MTHLEELVQHLKLRRNPLLERSIAEAMTINETSFFRDSRPFELLRTDLLPRLVEARRNPRTLEKEVEADEEFTKSNFLSCFCVNWTLKF